LSFGPECIAYAQEAFFDGAIASKGIMDILAWGEFEVVIWRMFWEFMKREL
jgi:hypothetical protein